MFSFDSLKNYRGILACAIPGTFFGIVLDKRRNNHSFSLVFGLLLFSLFLISCDENSLCTNGQCGDADVIYVYVHPDCDRCECVDGDSETVEKDSEKPEKDSEKNEADEVEIDGDSDFDSAENQDLDLDEKSDENESTEIESEPEDSEPDLIDENDNDINELDEEEVVEKTDLDFDPELEPEIDLEKEVEPDLEPEIEAEIEAEIEPEIELEKELEIEPEIEIETSEDGDIDLVENDAEIDDFELEIIEHDLDETECCECEEDSESCECEIELEAELEEAELEPEVELDPEPELELDELEPEPELEEDEIEVDIGRCADDNGGCDPLVECTDDGDTSVKCGQCPTDYSGSGYVGCIPVWNKHYGRLTMFGCEEKKIRYYRNHPLADSNSDVKRAVIVIHGTNRNYEDYYRYMYETAQVSRKTHETLIISPKFMIADDSPNDDELYWDTSGGWKRGDLSTTNYATRISSYEAMDAIVYKIAVPDRFPNLEELVFVGHSAGGQFVQHYAAGSGKEDELNFPVRYIVANPGSYLYLDGRRAKAGSKTEFEIPTTTCTEYNHYRYGLEDLNSYMSSAGAIQIKINYEKRLIIHMLGTEDTQTDEPYFDDSCMGNLQGDNRFERGEIFFNYTEMFYSEIYNRSYQPHYFIIVDGIGHSASGMFYSPKGRQTIFDWSVDDAIH